MSDLRPVKQVNLNLYLYLAVATRHKPKGRCRSVAFHAVVARINVPYCCGAHSGGPQIDLNGRTGAIYHSFNTGGARLYPGLPAWPGPSEPGCPRQGCAAAARLPTGASSASHLHGEAATDFLLDALGINGVETDWQLQVCSDLWPDDGGQVLAGAVKLAVADSLCLVFLQ